MKPRLHIVWIGLLMASCAVDEALVRPVLINPTPLDIPHALVVGESIAVSEAEIGVCPASESCPTEPDYCLASPHAEGCPTEGGTEWASEERAPL